MGEGVICFKSATKPWKIPFIVRKEGKEQIVNILVKFEEHVQNKVS